VISSTETSSGRRPWAARIADHKNPSSKSQGISVDTSGAASAFVHLQLYHLRFWYFNCSRSEPSSLACLSLVAAQGQWSCNLCWQITCANLFVGIWFCNNWDSPLPPSRGNLDLTLSLCFPAQELWRCINCGRLAYAGVACLQCTGQCLG